MGNRRLLSATLILLAVGLYLTPPSLLLEWRLKLYDWYVEASRSVASSKPSPEEQAEELPLRLRVRELRDRLLQKDAELARLKKLLQDTAGFRMTYPDLRFVIARVVAAGATQAEGAVLVDRGTADGVVKGAGVMQGSSLVGVVAETGEHASQVLLLSAPGSILPARAGTTRETCSVHGDGQNRAHVVFYVPQVKARRDEPILSSGLLGGVPPDLVIGTLQDDPSDGDEANTTQARIQLGGEFSLLDDVLILTTSVRAAEAATAAPASNPAASSASATSSTTAAPAPAGP